jgi:transcriptional regulator with XRE-family HTH domain
MAGEKRSTETVLRALGCRVSELRSARGLTQEQAAARLRMLAPNYARIEQGRQNVTVETLVQLANFLDVSMPDLFATPASSGPRGVSRSRFHGENVRYQPESPDAASVTTSNYATIEQAFAGATAPLFATRLSSIYPVKHWFDAR